MVRQIDLDSIYIETILSILKNVTVLINAEPNKSIYLISSDSNEKHLIESNQKYISLMMSHIAYIIYKKDMEFFYNLSKYLKEIKDAEHELENRQSEENEKNEIILNAHYQAYLKHIRDEINKFIMIMEELIRQLREQYKLQSNLHVKLEDFFSYTDSVVKKGLEQYINNSPNNPNFEIFQKLIKENTSEVENILQDTFRAAILDNRVSSYEDFMNISPQIFSHKIKEFNTEIQHSDISDNIYEEASVDIINTIINVDNDFKRKCEETIFHRKNLDSSYKTSNEILNNIHNRIINIDVMVIEEIKKMDSIPNIEQLKYSRNKLHSLSNELENNNNLRSFSTKNENNVSSSDMSNPSHSVNQTLKDKLRNAKGEKVLEENITSKQSNPIKSDKEPQQTVVSKESSPTQQSLKDRLRNAQGNKESEDSSVLRPKR